MASVSIHADAELEYEGALAWYLARSAKAGARFEGAFERAVESIGANPHLHPLCDHRHRFCQLLRFPYSLIYRVDGDKVRVVAVAHSRRLPGYWARRS